MDVLGKKDGANQWGTTLAWRRRWDQEVAVVYWIC